MKELIRYLMSLEFNLLAKWNHWWQQGEGWGEGVVI